MKNTGWCENDFNVHGYLAHLWLASTCPERSHMPSQGQPSHLHAPLYILYRESLREYAEWCTNDFTAHGYKCPAVFLQSLGRVGAGRPFRKVLEETGVVRHMRGHGVDRSGCGVGRGVERHDLDAGVAIQVILTPPCIFCIENHE